MNKAIYLGIAGGFFSASLLAAGYIYFNTPKVAPSDFGKLTTCADSGYPGLSSPTYLYKINITGKYDSQGKPIPFDFHYPVVTKIVTPISGTGTPPPPDTTTDVTSKTRLDLRFDLQLKESAKVQITLDDPSLEFQKDGAIWDPKPVKYKNEYRSKMLCDLAITSDMKTITFIVHAPEKDINNPNKKIFHVQPNIGIVVKDSTDPNSYSLPIFLDPDYENEGIW